MDYGLKAKLNTKTLRNRRFRSKKWAIDHWLFLTHYQFSFIYLLYMYFQYFVFRTANPATTFFVGKQAIDVRTKHPSTPPMHTQMGGRFANSPIVQLPTHLTASRWCVGWVLGWCDRPIGCRWVGQIWHSKHSPTLPPHPWTHKWAGNPCFFVTIQINSPT